MDEAGLAAQVWHAGLTPPVAAESAEWLDEQLRRRGLFFGDRPLCNVLRPRFLSVDQYREIRIGVVPLLRAFDRALEAALADSRALDRFRLLDWERTLALEDPGILPSPVSRLDAFFEAGTERLRFTEYNAETPAGSAYHDALTELFLAIPAARPFLRSHSLRPLPARNGVLHALLESYRNWSGKQDPPTIGILDWTGVPTWSEFLLFRDYFEAMGVRTVVADVRSCTLEQGRLHANGIPIDLIYKRVLIGELIGREGLEHPVVRAVRSGAVCMVNPFRCKILHKKASLAVLSDERNTEWFEPEQRAAIERYIPWTRVVEERTTVREGRSIDLLPWVERNQDCLVLKPNDEYGGAGIVLGWEVDGAAWSAAIRKALAEPYIVQERIGLPEESYPAWVDGQVAYAPRIVDTAPFVFGAAGVDSCLTRVSTATLVNVTAGGGSTVPTFVVERR